MIDVILKFEGKELVLSFPPSNMNAVQMASKFCSERMPVESHDEEQRKECIRRIGDYLIREVERNQQNPNPSRQQSEQLLEQQEKVLSVKLDIQGKLYDLTINPETEEVRKVAQKFCFEHAETFRIQSSDLDAYCTSPIEQKLIETIQQAKSDKVSSSSSSSSSSLPSSSLPATKTESKRKAQEDDVEIVLTISNDSYTIYYNPKRHHNYEAAAREFCFEYQSQFGLNDQNIDEYCVFPLTNSIEEYQRTLP